jgi:hypothetical protein
LLVGRWHLGAAYVIDGTGPGAGNLEARPGNNFIYVQKMNNTNITAYAQFTVIGQVMFEVQ